MHIVMTLCKQTSLDIYVTPIPYPHIPTKFLVARDRHIDTSLLACFESKEEWVQKKKGGLVLSSVKVMCIVTFSCYTHAYFTHQFSLHTLHTLHTSFHVTPTLTLHTPAPSWCITYAISQYFASLVNNDNENANAAQACCRVCTATDASP